MSKRAVELSELFVKLSLINNPSRIPDKEAIRKAFIGLLKTYDFEKLWSAIYFGLSDDFWKKNIKNTASFKKHADTLVERGEDYNCPIPIDPDGHTPTELITYHKSNPQPSALQLYLENKRCRRKQLI
jgi:hypothetical protein